MHKREAHKQCCNSPLPTTFQLTLPSITFSAGSLSQGLINYTSSPVARMTSLPPICLDPFPHKDPKPWPIYLQYKGVAPTTLELGLHPNTIQCLCLLVCPFTLNYHYIKSLGLHPNTLEVSLLASFPSGLLVCEKNGCYHTGRVKEETRAGSYYLMKMYICWHLISRVEPPLEKLIAMPI